MIRQNILAALQQDETVIAPLRSALAEQLMSACPVLSLKGYEVVKVPPRLYELIYRRTIKAYYLQNLILQEEGAGHAIPNRMGVAPELCYLEDNFFSRVHNDPEFIALHSRFAGFDVRPSFFFGPRVYHHSDVLKEHIDHPNTHILGSSINVFCEGDPDWPLVFRVGNVYEEVVLSPGEMVIFEAVRIPHSRPVPFNGDRYFGLFYHFEPVNPGKVLSPEYFELAARYEELMKTR